MPQINKATTLEKTKRMAQPIAKSGKAVKSSKSSISAKPMASLATKGMNEVKKAATAVKKVLSGTSAKKPDAKMGTKMATKSPLKSGAKNAKAMRPVKSNASTMSTRTPRLH